MNMTIKEMADLLDGLMSAGYGDHDCKIRHYDGKEITLGIHGCFINKGDETGPAPVFHASVDYGAKK